MVLGVYIQVFDKLRKLTLLAILALSLSACQSPGVSKSDPSLVISVFNDISRERLGVSLPALSYLANWSPDNYVLEEYLEYSGGIHLIRELQDANLIETDETLVLPDGTQTGQRHIHIKPTDAGIRIIAAFHKLREDGSWLNSR